MIHLISGQSRFGKALMLSGVLALDAPLVAGAWWYLFAAGFDKNPDWRIFFSLIPAVWAIYLFDRICDVAAFTSHLPERKRFARDHPVLLRVLLGLALLWAAGAAWYLPGPVWWQIGAIGAGTGFYFVRNRWKSSFSRIPAKEALIAFCFAAGVALPLQHPISGLRLGTLGLFASLCFLNCLMISRNESIYDATADPQAWFSKSDRDFPFCRVFVGHALTIVFLLWCGLPLIPGFCLLGSNLLLYLVHLSADKARSPMVQAFCDAALWIPGLLGAVRLAFEP